MRNLLTLSLLLTIVIVSACHPLPKREPQVVAAPDKVSQMLANAADKAATSLESLAAVEQARSPNVSVEPIVNAPPELMRAMTIQWVGPADQLLEKLADRASYNFLAVGDRPPVPIVVNVDVTNEPVIDLLRNVGLQMGVRGDVKVDSTRKVVELQYAPVTGIGR